MSYNSAYSYSSTNEFSGEGKNDWVYNTLDIDYGYPTYTSYSNTNTTYIDPDYLANYPSGGVQCNSAHNNYFTF